MVATDSALRITIRIDIPDSAYPSTCIDLAVPRNSSIAEILDEVLTLADAPRISRPWQATTAAGVLIDAAHRAAPNETAISITITQEKTSFCMVDPFNIDAASSRVWCHTCHPNVGRCTIASF